MTVVAGAAGVPRLDGRNSFRSVLAASTSSPRAESAAPLVDDDDDDDAIDDDGGDGSLVLDARPTSAIVAVLQGNPIAAVARTCRVDVRVGIDTPRGPPYLPQTFRA